MACAALCVAAWALVVPALASRQSPYDAAAYLAMVEGGPTAAPPPFRYRWAAPALASALPAPPATALAAVTFGSLTLAAAAWWLAARRLGLSARVVGWAAALTFSTQGWALFFHDPWLVDAPGQLGLIAAWGLWLANGAWLSSGLWLSLAVLAFGSSFRETSALASLWWGADRRWWSLGSALTACAIGLLAPRLLWPAPAPPGPLFDAWLHKGPGAIVGDAFASLHGLWALAPMGVWLAPAPLRRALGWPLASAVLAAAGLSFIATNTVRMFSLALPFASLAAAYCLDRWAITGRRAQTLAWVLVSLAPVGGLLWFPLAPSWLWGEVAWLSVAHKGWQAAFCGVFAAGSVAIAVAARPRSTPAAPSR